MFQENFKFSVIDWGTGQVVQSPKGKPLTNLSFWNAWKWAQWFDWHTQINAQYVPEDQEKYNEAYYNSILENCPRRVK